MDTDIAHITTDPEFVQNDTRISVTILPNLLLVRNYLTDDWEQSLATSKARMLQQFSERIVAIELLPPVG